MAAAAMLPTGAAAAELPLPMEDEANVEVEAAASKAEVAAEAAVAFSASTSPRRRYRLPPAPAPEASEELDASVVRRASSAFKKSILWACELSSNRYFLSSDSSERGNPCSGSMCECFFLVLVLYIYALSGRPGGRPTRHASCAPAPRNTIK